MLTASISVNVTPLPDNAVWFANAAAWNNYWANITADVEFDPAATTIYAPSPYNDALVPYTLNVDGVETTVPTIAMFNSLKAQVAVLDSEFQLMRTQMRTAGYITNAQ